jgi:hypothetical protein
MADEAFALSPISARAALPGEEDYAAISEAFMETSRGRWFLGEYAKRNRNADTRMVLDAVARIEQSLAAQKEDGVAAQREAAAAAVAADASLNEAKLVETRLAETRLAETMASIRHAVEAAQAAAIEALDGLALDERLAPVRKGARVIREIAWRLREIGNDGRICDLIDSQVSVIEQGAEQISCGEARAALSAAFATIEGRLAEFGDEVTPPQIAEAQAASPAPAPQEVLVAVAETIEPEPVQEVAQVSSSLISNDAAAPAADAPLARADAAPEEMETTDTEVVELSAEAAEAHDEAVLDMIAMEMGAPDPFDGDEIAAPVTEVAHVTEPPPLELGIVAPFREPVAAPIEPPVQPVPEPVAEAVPESPRAISLGSSIIASGIVRKPGIAANDPLAPIRRMSQAEKIAFFS